MTFYLGFSSFSNCIIFFFQHRKWLLNYKIKYIYRKWDVCLFGLLNYLLCNFSHLIINLQLTRFIRCHNMKRHSCTILDNLILSHCVIFPRIPESGDWFRSLLLSFILSFVNNEVHQLWSKVWYTLPTLFQRYNPTRTLCKFSPFKILCRLQVPRCTQVKKKVVTGCYLWYLTIQRLYVYT
jgi:hypothetical protein